MKIVKKTSIPVVLALLVLVVLPEARAQSLSLVRVGYINVDKVLDTYTRNYLDTMIEVRERYLEELEAEYNAKFYTMGYREKSNMETQLRERREELRNLRLNRRVFSSTGEIRDDMIFHTVQGDIMDAVKKTSELEGFSLVLDNSGNFVYGSEDINLTAKVLFRLDERLLDMRERQPGNIMPGGIPSSEEPETDSENDGEQD